MQPPRLATDLNRLFVYDKQTWWTLHADRFGAILKRYGREQPQGLVEQAGNFRLGSDEVINWNSIVLQFSKLREAKTMACDGDTLAVALPHRHRVYLIARGTSWAGLDIR